MKPKINRKYIKVYIKDSIKIIEVTSLSLTQYIEQYLKEEWDIYTFLYIDITGKFDDNIQVYEMQYTPLVSEQKLIKAIQTLEDSIVYKNFNVASKQTQIIENDFAPNDWEDYWDYQKALANSFASKKLQNSKIKKLDSYSEVIVLSDEFRTVFPFFSKLLDLARVTKIITESNEIFYLLGWSYEYGHFGALMPEIGENYTKDILYSHQLILNNFGGFIDWFGEVIDSHYFCVADHCEITMKYLTQNQHLDKDFIQFTEEANGDFYCYHIKSEEVWKHHLQGGETLKEEYGTDIKLVNTNENNDILLFKVDHCSFVQWVERGAQSWLNCLEELPFDMDKL